MKGEHSKQRERKIKRKKVKKKNKEKTADGEKIKAPVPAGLSQLSSDKPIQFLDE